MEANNNRSSADESRLQANTNHALVDDDDERKEVCAHFCLREYVTEVRKCNPKLCSPFHSCHGAPDGGVANSLPPLSFLRFRRWDCAQCLNDDVLSSENKLVELCQCQGPVITSISTATKDAVPSPFRGAELLPYVGPQVSSSDGIVCEVRFMHAVHRRDFHLPNAEPTCRTTSIGVCRNSQDATGDKDGGSEKFNISAAIQQLDSEKDIENMKTEDAPTYISADALTSTYEKHDSDTKVIKCKMSNKRIAPEMDSRWKKESKIRLLSDLMNSKKSRVPKTSTRSSKLHVYHMDKSDKRWNGKMRNDGVVILPNGHPPPHRRATDKDVRYKRKFVSLDDAEENLSLICWLKRSGKRVKSKKSCTGKSSKFQQIDLGSNAKAHSPQEAFRKHNECEVPSSDIADTVKKLVRKGRQHDGDSGSSKMVQKVEKGRTKGSLCTSPSEDDDDIPMDIVELLAQNMQQKLLADDENSFDVPCLENRPSNVKDRTESHGCSNIIINCSLQDSLTCKHGSNVWNSEHSRSSCTGTGTDSSCQVPPSFGNSLATGMTDTISNCNQQLNCTDGLVIRSPFPHKHNPSIEAQDFICSRIQMQKNQLSYSHEELIGQHYSKLGNDSSSDSSYAFNPTGGSFSRGIRFSPGHCILSSSSELLVRTPLAHDTDMIRLICNVKHDHDRNEIWPPPRAPPFVDASQSNILQLPGLCSTRTAHPFSMMSPSTPLGFSVIQRPSKNRMEHFEHYNYRLLNQCEPVKRHPVLLASNQEWTSEQRFHQPFLPLECKGIFRSLLQNRTDILNMVSPIYPCNYDPVLARTSPSYKEGPYSLDSFAVDRIRVVNQRNQMLGNIRIQDTCVINRNPVDFTIIGENNRYMISVCKKARR